tara:strand:+ start:157 stop:723 length:567 start_codon:yes stop_codon:yes gene_type:complete
MKLYLLRHEIRNLRNPTFYSPLLPEGLKNAEKLKFILSNEKINLVFSSPFKRVLQTVKPFCDMKNMKVNIEFSLYEQIYYHTDIDINFDKNDFRKDLKPSDDEYYLKNINYKSYLPLNQIEFTKDTKRRGNDFINYIINKYKDTNYNIVLASHGGLISQILDIDDRYPMGGLCLCYDGERRCNKPINF